MQPKFSIYIPSRPIVEARHPIQRTEVGGDLKSINYSSRPKRVHCRNISLYERANLYPPFLPGRLPLSQIIHHKNVSTFDSHITIVLGIPWLAWLGPWLAGGADQSGCHRYMTVHNDAYIMKF